MLLQHLLLLPPQQLLLMVVVVGVGGWQQHPHLLLLLVGGMILGRGATKGLVGVATTAGHQIRVVTTGAMVVGVEEVGVGVEHSTRSPMGSTDGTTHVGMRDERVWLAVRLPSEAVNLRPSFAIT
jgi:hypothetical protein